MELSDFDVVYTGMETTIFKSHAVSAVFHGIFLWLAFIAPVVLVLDKPPQWASLDRTIRLEPRTVVIETGFRMPPTIDEFTAEGRGSAPSDGAGEASGARAGQKVKSNPPDPERQIAAAPEVGLVEGIEGLLTGFAAETLGPDALTALGALDDGGGGRNDFGFGMGLAGGGVSCYGSWKYERDGTRTLTKSDGCKGIRPGGGFATGMLGLGRGSEPTPDLGDKVEATVRPTVITGEAVGCLTSSACPWKEIVRGVIQRHERELSYCYERSLDRLQRRFDANIDVSFKLPPEGGRADVEIASTSGVDDFDGCVHDRLSAWVFPQTGENIRANYPFRFAAL